MRLKLNIMEIQVRLLILKLLLMQYWNLFLHSWLKMFLLLLTLLKSLIFLMIMSLLSVIIIIILIRGDNMNKYFNALCQGLMAAIGALLGVNIDFLF